jgi:hypothetical protein
MGKTFVLASDGGVGKSFFLLQLAVCIALGRDLFEVLHPEESGRVALLMGEDDLDECHDRLWRICNAMGLSADERAEVGGRVLLFPLAGSEVSLLELDEAKSPRRTAVFEQIVQRLKSEAADGSFGWTFIGLDPLARFAGGNAEGDNAVATALVQALEEIAQTVPGRPAVGMTHHSSKSAVRAGGADVRGVTGLRNAFRAALTMTNVRVGNVRGVRLENEKNNHAPEADLVWLVREDGLDTGGVLRPATDEERKVLIAAAAGRESTPPGERAAAKQATVSAQFAADCATLLKIVPLKPATSSRHDIEGALRGMGEKWGDQRLGAALSSLRKDGRIEDLSSGRRSSPRRWARVSDEP